MTCVCLFSFSFFHLSHDLQAEKTELKEYQELDRERRSLEYALYDKEVLTNYAVMMHPMNRE
jgi:hypothetical protein